MIKSFKLNPIIRIALPEDAEQLLAHLQGLSEETGIDVPLSPGEIKITLEEERQIITDYANSENSVFLVAEENAAIVGELTCKGGSLKAFHHSASLGMSVKKGWRGKGIGNTLMKAALDWARENSSLRRIELNVYVRNVSAIHLYQKYGFELEGRRRAVIYQDGEFLDDYVMALSLKRQFLH
jgi:RimJ/RimL family protein N-acetyltransferase